MALFKRHSSVSGDGIFTDAPIKKGEKLYTFTGERVSIITTFWRTVFSKVERPDDPFQIGRYEYLDLDDFPRYFNHSCDPNSGIMDLVDLVAIRDIPAGAEITFDYATTVSPEISWWSMPCQCGTAICRHKVLPADHLPPELRQRYKALGFLPAFAQIKRRRVNLPWVAYQSLRVLGFIKPDAQKTPPN